MPLPSSFDGFWWEIYLHVDCFPATEMVFFFGGFQEFLIFRSLVMMWLGINFFESIPHRLPSVSWLYRSSYVWLNFGWAIITLGIFPAHPSLVPQDSDDMNVTSFSVVPKVPKTWFLFLNPNLSLLLRLDVFYCCKRHGSLSFCNPNQALYWMFYFNYSTFQF